MNQYLYQIFGRFHKYHFHLSIKLAEHCKKTGERWLLIESLSDEEKERIKQIEGEV